MILVDCFDGQMHGRYHVMWENVGLSTKVAKNRRVDYCRKVDGLAKQVARSEPLVCCAQADENKHAGGIGNQESKWYVGLMSIKN